MPIVTVPLGPGPVAVGPGLTVQFQSDFVGPLPVGTTWHYAVTDEEDLEFDRVFLAAAFGGQANPARATFMTSVATMQVDGRMPTQNENMRVQVRLQDSGANVIDESIITLPWDGTRGLGAQQLLTPTSTGGGLTAAQALELKQSQQATWPQHVVDELLFPSQGVGDSENPILADLTSPVFAVVVRIYTIPDGLAPITPDEQYWLPTLAVVRVFRQNDIWLRVPIHTPTKIVNLWVEGLMLGLVDAVTAAGWLLGLKLHVTFLPGVTGEVFLMRLP